MGRRWDAVKAYGRSAGAGLATTASAAFSSAASHITLDNINKCRISLAAHAYRIKRGTFTNAESLLRTSANLVKKWNIEGERRVHHKAKDPDAFPVAKKIEDLDNPAPGSP